MQEYTLFVSLVGQQASVAAIHSWLAMWYLIAHGCVVHSFVEVGAVHALIPAAQSNAWVLLNATVQDTKALLKDSDDGRVTLFLRLSYQCEVDYFFLSTQEVTATRQDAT